MGKDGNSKLDLFDKKGVTETTDVVGTLKIRDKVKLKPQIITSAYRQKLCVERVYTVFQIPKWGGDEVVLKPFNFKGLRERVLPEEAVPITEQPTWF